jgi:hypothetical protein
MTSTQFPAENTGIQQVFPMSDEPRINPQALAIPDAAQLLSKAGGRAIRPDQIEADVAAGAPQNSDGTVNLVTYAAWLARERGRGD